MSRTELALQRLLRSDLVLRRDIEGMILEFLRKYNPDQPRVPAGNLDGGQWTSTGAGQGSFGLQPDTVRPLLQRPSVVTPVTPDLRTLVQQAFFDDRHNEDDVLPLLPMEGVSPFAHSHGIRPLDPMGGLDPSAHPFDILAIPLALALYRWLSASNSPSSQAVINFVARGSSRDADNGPFDRAGVANLDYDRAKDACGDSIEKAQSMTDEAVEQVLKDGDAALSPTQFGTAVHWQLKQTVDKLKDPNFRAEVSLIKTEEAEKEAGKEADYYGQKDSIRVDILARPVPQTACVYDIKTGKAGLSLARTKEIMEHVYLAFGEVRNIIVTEIRPTPWRQREK